MKKILILTNSINGFYSFRNELIDELLKSKYEVIISSPYDSKSDYYMSKGISVINTTIHRHGKNPFNDFKLLLYYRNIIRKFKPIVILTYTIKPNIYGGLAARITKTPYLPNITGLGTALENKGLLQFITLRLYKVALKKANTIFFQNKENMNFMLKRGIKGKNQVLLPGSGVNVKMFNYLEYPKGKTIHFLFIGRVMKAKGIDYYLGAAKYIKSKYPNTVFHILGDYEEDYKMILNDYEAKGYIEYSGRVDDVREFHKISHATIHPTYYPEGMSNVLLESASSGRPVIATNRSGCKEIIEDRKNGYLIEIKNQEELNEKIETFINLDYLEKKKMGIYGREKVIKEFDRSVVIRLYIEEIKKIGDKK
ncbi:glycosyltransferase family 4 protein [Mycoplasmatota bacterium]|nr:glycosyltransferase family 4 protein [Mycoplasmatota bacterium]